MFSSLLLPLLQLFCDVLLPSHCTCQRAVAWSDRVDSDHAQAETLRVLQLLLAHVKTITEEVVVCAGHSAET